MSIRKRSWTSPNGERKSAWQVDYVDNSGSRRRETYATKKEADAAHLKARTAVNAGTHTAAAASITVADAATRWIDHCVGRGLEPSTVAAYRQHVALHINPYLGGVRLASLSIPMVPDFQDRLRADGRSAPMVRKARIALGAILKHAQKRGLVGQNIVRALGRDDDHVTDRAAARPSLQAGVDIPTPAEIRAIAATLPGRRYHALLLTAFFAGLRASELRGLRWCDVDLKRGEITVRQRADRFGRLGPPKSKAGTRSIPLLPMVVAVLREHKLATPANALDLVFPNSKGNVDHLNTIVEGWQAAQVAGLGAAKYSGLHSIRHFYASWCINRVADGGLELPMKVVQTRLGHATISMTADTYGHLFPTGDASAEMAEAQRRWLA
jgi:integrase